MDIYHAHWRILISFSVVLTFSPIPTLHVCTLTCYKTIQILSTQAHVIHDFQKTVFLLCYSFSLAQTGQSKPFYIPTVQETAGHSLCSVMGSRHATLKFLATNLAHFRKRDLTAPLPHVREHGPQVSQDMRSCAVSYSFEISLAADKTDLSFCDLFEGI